MRLAENTGRKKSPKIRHLRTIARLCRAISLQLRHISTIGKNLLNSNIFSRCPHNMVNVGPLTAEIGLPVWGTTAYLNRFRVLASLLQRRRLTEPNQGTISVTAWHSRSGLQPNFATWYNEWNYGTFADGATYIRLGGHHDGHWPTF